MVAIFIRATLSYELPDLSKINRQVSIYGFSTISFEEIPLEAKNINLELNYLTIFNNKETKKRFFWKSPLGSWPTGNRTIKIKGSWPAQPSFNEQ